MPEPMTSDDTLNALEDAISAHFKKLWEEGGVGVDEDYVGDWAVVIHFGSLSDELPSSGYSVETKRNMPPHHVKGLLSEGIDWVADAQEGEFDD